jgi:hypothetical protein
MSGGQARPLGTDRLTIVVDDLGSIDECSAGAEIRPEGPRLDVRDLDPQVLRLERQSQAESLEREFRRTVQ